LGVLVEKAKTTPDAYPLSLNALVTGCNQKNNRYPLSQYEAEHIEDSVDRLRLMGAVAAVQGSGRVGKYRHYMYEWLGVEKIELSIMTELLLRGAQTEGDLRGRVARMDPIPDLATLRSLLDSLKAKGLVQALTPEGRGQIISHTLYLPEEMEKVRRNAQATDAATPAHAPTPAHSPAPSHSSPQPSARPAAEPAGRHEESSRSAPADNGDTAALRREVTELRTAIAQLRSDLADLVGQTQKNTDELAALRQSLGG
jgi:hypothetical protein